VVNTRKGAHRRRGATIRSRSAAIGFCNCSASSGGADSHVSSSAGDPQTRYQSQRREGVNRSIAALNGRTSPYPGTDNQRRWKWQAPVVGPHVCHVPCPEPYQLAPIATFNRAAKANKLTFDYSYSKHMENIYCSPSSSALSKGARSTLVLPGMQTGVSRHWLSRRTCLLLLQHQHRRCELRGLRGNVPGKTGLRMRDAQVRG
jgi:hypothetical protein